MFLVILLLLMIGCNFCVDSTREKRQLMFPPQSIMQLAFAVVTPAEVRNHKLSTNMGIMFNIDLPTNLSQWYPWRPDYRRKRSANTDQALFNILDAVMSLNGIDGRACLQKSVCQMKEDPIETDHILVQILNIIFGHKQKHTEVYYVPQSHNSSCDIAFPTCQFTPVDLFLHLFSSSWTSSR